MTIDSHKNILKHVLYNIPSLATTKPDNTGISYPGENGS